jgi:hypothetical protein
MNFKVNFHNTSDFQVFKSLILELIMECLSEAHQQNRRHVRSDSLRRLTSWVC